MPQAVLNAGFTRASRWWLNCPLWPSSAGADLVITGEGSLDAQTFHGKTPLGLARMATVASVPVIALAGSLGEGYQRLTPSPFQLGGDANKFQARAVILDKFNLSRRVFSARSGARSSHSHIVNTAQPCSSKAWHARRSRSTLFLNFSCQKPSRVLGLVEYWQLGCRCQKQPWTKMQVFSLGSTMSGFPGRSARWSRKR
jgi:hypothetical protein